MGLALLYAVIIGAPLLLVYVGGLILGEGDAEKDAVAEASPDDCENAQKRVTESLNEDSDEQDTKSDAVVMACGWCRRPVDRSQARFCPRCGRVLTDSPSA